MWRLLVPALSPSRFPLSRVGETQNKRRRKKSERAGGTAEPHFDPHAKLLKKERKVFFAGSSKVNLSLKVWAVLLRPFNRPKPSRAFKPPNS